MKKTFLIIVVLGIIGFFIYWRDFASNNTKPTADQMVPVIEKYLKAGNTLPCREPLEILKLSDISVGDYNDRFGGWQVYASHQERCPSTRTTYDGLDSTHGLGFVHYNHFGQPEMFVPEEIQKMLNLMKQKLNSIRP